jgi:hypothetical protein
VALSELWGLVGVAENALLLVSAFVVVVGLFGMLTALLTSLEERPDGRRPAFQGSIPRCGRVES